MEYASNLIKAREAGIKVYELSIAISVNENMNIDTNDENFDKACKAVSDIYLGNDSLDIDDITYSAMDLIEDEKITQREFLDRLADDKITDLAFSFRDSR